MSAATRKQIVRRRYAGGLALAAVLAVVLLLLLVDRDPTTGARGTGRGAVGADLADSTALFTIAGEATGSISPGVKVPLDLKLTNPLDVRMSVAGLTVTVQKVNAPNADHVHPCAVGDFAVDQASSSVKIALAARMTSTLSSLGLPTSNQPHIGMLNSSANQDGCKGASLTLAFTASGTPEK
jgi:hypothetical protein